jgi:hypothetical protein
MTGSVARAETRRKSGRVRRVERRMGRGWMVVPERP